MTVQICVGFEATQGPNPDTCKDPFVIPSCLSVRQVLSPSVLQLGPLMWKSLLRSQSCKQQRMDSGPGSRLQGCVYKSPQGTGVASDGKWTGLQGGEGGDLIKRPHKQRLHPHSGPCRVDKRVPVRVTDLRAGRRVEEMEVPTGQEENANSADESQMER